jgi:hypothetical protein
MSKLCITFASVKETRKDMKEIESRIYVTQELLLNEYDYVYGNKKNQEVTFVYYNVKKDREGTEKTFENYSKALDFARYRRNDGRYRNYEFFIYNKV